MIEPLAAPRVDVTGVTLSEGVAARHSLAAHRAVASLVLADVEIDALDDGQAVETLARLARREAAFWRTWTQSTWSEREQFCDLLAVACGLRIWNVEPTASDCSPNCSPTRTARLPRRRPRPRDAQTETTMQRPNRRTGPKAEAKIDRATAANVVDVLLPRILRARIEKYDVIGDFNPRLDRLVQVSSGRAQELEAAEAQDETRAALAEARLALRAARVEYAAVLRERLAQLAEHGQRNIEKLQALQRRMQVSRRTRLREQAKAAGARRRGR